MLKRLFPRQIDNFYQGHVLAIWLFLPVLALKTAMGFNVGGLNPFVSSRFILNAADGVPVDTYPAEAAAHLVFTFAAWGLVLFVLTLFGWLVVARYRTMLPLLMLLFSLEQVGRMVLSRTLLPHHAAASAGIPISTLINWGFAGLLLLALMLSLLNVRPRPA
ncbi:MAG: hypothetical protein WAU68_02075 [Vitreimonas sp.]